MKGLLKSAMRAVCRALVIPHYLFYRLEAMFHDPDKAFHGASQSLARFPGLFGEYLRHEFYRLALEECGRDCCISFGTIFSKRGARLGNRVYIGTGCTLGLVTLGDDVLLASNVDVLSGSGQHGFEDVQIPIREQKGVIVRVAIGADSWIGNRCVVMADVGQGSVVGAGSVVTKPIPDRSLAVGSPARVVGIRGGADSMARLERERRTGE
jgi:acetyltransferase-like isoleucine patch superfamily enzyme